MYRRTGLITFYIFALLSLALVSRHGEYVSMLLTPVCVMFLFVFFHPKNKGLIVPGFLLFLVYIAFKLHASEMHSRWFMFQGVTVSMTAACFFVLKYYWELDVLAMHRRASSTGETTEGLAVADERSSGELKQLDGEVNEIVGLFELAREFNECINLREIIQVLSRQVFDHLPFERGKLVFLDDDLLLSSEDETHMLHLGKPKPAGEDTVREMTFDQELVARLAKREVPTRFESAGDDREGILTGQSVHFPLWIFPLATGREVTAAFWVEGARKEDFGKFEIIASQLALHVNKVRLYNRVKELSIVDGLTKLFVRRHFIERFQEELTRSAKYQLSLVVLVLDIDHFKAYNDTYGHLVGDVALRQVAQTIKEVIRRVDVAGRLGGEEFAVVLPETDYQGGMDAAERIRSRVAKRTFRAYDEETRLTVSIGITVFPADIQQGYRGSASDDLTSRLLTQADEALYRAKEEGRNQIAAYRDLPSK